MTVKAVRKVAISLSAVALTTLSLHSLADQRSEFAILAGMASTIHNSCAVLKGADNNAKLAQELRNLTAVHGLSNEFQKGVELGLTKVRSAESVEICSSEAQENYLIVLASVVAPLQASAPQMVASK